ncbi:hypothetical protein GIB67_021151 [Kingdonia uniflora]|uniref:Uncharacterized protein n=1 Tax=Kingdonia uniflora TaxID=39325 RepID=A0A7J7N7G9_9MAGN|nr:hypothetical protein GIB67_021151 [Kingdonia uniflora]
MGILSWWSSKQSADTKTTPKSDPKRMNSAEIAEISGMNGAMLVPRPDDLTVFEFGSAAASTDKVTLAGHCSVSEELEPCHWVILPATESGAPQFRVPERDSFHKDFCYFAKSKMVGNKKKTGSRQPTPGDRLRVLEEFKIMTENSLGEFNAQSKETNWALNSILQLITSNAINGQREIDSGLTDSGTSSRGR